MQLMKGFVGDVFLYPLTHATSWMLPWAGPFRRLFAEVLSHEQPEAMPMAVLGHANQAVEACGLP